jgi:Fur family ferric uptake transcriptional regulator
MIDYQSLLSEFKSLLKRKELKFTKQRELVLKALYLNDGHFSPEELLSLIREKEPNIKIGIATVYRTLSLLEEQGLAYSISLGKDGKRYELGLKTHHDHLVCIGCGKIIEFFDEVIESRQEEVAREFNFLMKEHIMQLRGLCSECQDKNRS